MASVKEVNKPHYYTTKPPESICTSLLLTLAKVDFDLLRVMWIRLFLNSRLY